MNDRRVESLVRMAFEVEELEREAIGLDGGWAESDPMPIRISRGWRLGRTAGMLAAAACVGLAAIGAWQLWGQVGSARQSLALLNKEHPASAGGGLAVKPVPETTIPVAPIRVVPTVPARTIAVSYPGRPVQAIDQDCGVVVVIVHDLRGMTRCVRFRSEDWQGRCPSELSRWELTAPNEARACMTGSKQMLVLALSGPAGKLPTSDRGAEELAACILGLPRACDTEGSCYSGAAATCLPRDVNFKVETVAVR